MKDFLEKNPRLKPLANIAQDLSDEDLNECILFVAYLNYRRRIFAMAAKEREKLSDLIKNGKFPFEESR